MGPSVGRERVSLQGSSVSLVVAVMESVMAGPGLWLVSPTPSRLGVRLVVTLGLGVGWMVGPAAGVGSGAGVVGPRHRPGRRQWAS